ncbi:MAG: ABC transporter ATP-binding protein [Trueperaceae bacterium]
MTSSSFNRAGTGDRRNQGSGATLARYLRPQLGKVVLMAALLVGAIGLQLSIPQILRGFIDNAMAGVQVAELRRTAVWFLAIAFGYQLLAAVATYVGADVGWTATNRLRRELAGHILGLDMSFHTARTPGEMIERIDGDVTALSNFFSQFSVRVFGGLLLLLGILILLWLENPLVGLVLTLFTGLELVVLAWTRRLGVPATIEEREVNARLFGFIEERLGGIEDLRANGAGAHAVHRFGAVMRDFFHGTRRAWMMRSLGWLLSYGLFIASSATLLAAAIVLVSQGSITLGTGYMIFQYLVMLQTPIDQITQQMQELQKAAASIGRVRNLFAEQGTPEPTGGPVLPAGALAVEFDRVSFAYGEPVTNGDPSDAAAGDHRAGADGGRDRPGGTLNDVSFRLPAGKVLGLLGRTGSGKTTMTRLLFRLYQPTSGRIVLGGVESARVRTGSLRGRVGLVTQEVQLFQASVRDNLTFFRQDVPDEELTDLLNGLGMSRWLASLPEGLDTILTAGGGNLSAGEAQLLAFARVFLKDPGLVVLDEPSSRLDPATGRQLERVVDRLLAGRTGILIAHRLETVQRADYVMVLDGGRAVEFGERQRLVLDPESHYARLLAAAGLADAPVGARSGTAAGTAAGTALGTALGTVADTSEQALASGRRGQGRAGR